MNQGPGACSESLISVVSFERRGLVPDLLTETDLNASKRLAIEVTPGNFLRALTSDLVYLEAWHMVATKRVLSCSAPELPTPIFVAHHLYDAAGRARDPQLGTPEDVEIGRRSSGSLRTEGPQTRVTTTFHRGDVAPDPGRERAYDTPNLHEAAKCVANVG